MTSFTFSNDNHKQHLLEAGYKFFPTDAAGYKFFPIDASAKAIHGDWCVGLYQKKVTWKTAFGSGIAFFINIYQYDYGFFNKPGYLYEVGMQTTSQIHKNIALNISFNPSTITINQAESLVEDFFRKFGSDYE